MLTSNIRNAFLEFFKRNNHAVIPSSPVIPHEDPSLLFINAGMNQFKDVFLGKSYRDYVRAATSQKCIRVGGKHNDLENVGHTRRHLTFFEMLGNFSFGDYFKEDAIRFAWEVSTTIFGFDPERIWPTIFLDDDEAFEIWRKYVPESKITRFGEKENFWAMGDTGPCGPCSELLYDRGLSYGTASRPIEDLQGERFLEFWNLVFMQYNRDASGNLTPLPKPSIDTGAGLERIISLIMDVDNVFQTDILRAIIGQIESESNKTYETASPFAPAFHVISDHLRSLSFAIADGVQPSNVDRGYVLRKILRRAVRYGRTLGFEEPFLGKILPKLVETMGQDYPELKTGENRIAEILFIEEEAFFRTLKRGGNILNQVIEKSKAEKQKISGEDAFKLKDTYGLPFEEIQLIAKDHDLEIDLDRYSGLEQQAKERSRKTQKMAQEVVSESQFAEFAETHGDTHFLGYSELTALGKIIGIVVEGEFVDSIREGQKGLILLNQTPFYAEMGGQIGDSGNLKGDKQLFEVEDAIAPFKGLIGHIGTVKQGTFSLQNSVIASVNSERRQKIANNHTATHLLHWALHKVLGEHVKQAGSIVDENRLRFDFSHHKALTKEEIRSIEDIVNTKIRENKHVRSYEISYEEAQKQSEIKQFFGEKYGNKVRVIDIEKYSMELCGGTHTSATGNIGYFLIVGESSIAAGVRRIEAITGKDAENYARAQEDLLETAASLLKAQPQTLADKIGKLIEENKSNELKLRKEIIARQNTEVSNWLQSELIDCQGIQLLSKKLEVSPEELKSYADLAAEKLPSGVIALAAALEDKCLILIRITPDLVKKGIHANEIVKQISPIIGGSGGGKSNQAQAGGKAKENINEALDYIQQMLLKYETA